MNKHSSRRYTAKYYTNRKYIAMLYRRHINLVAVEVEDTYNSVLWLNLPLVEDTRLYLIVEDVSLNLSLLEHIQL